MNSEERFKKSLDELLGSKEFPFDESNWEKAREIIDASKKSKRRLVPFILSGLLFLGALLTGAYFLLDSPEHLSNTEKTSDISKTVRPEPTPTLNSGSKVPSTAKQNVHASKPKQTAAKKSPETELPVSVKETDNTQVKISSVKQTKKEIVPSPADPEGEQLSPEIPAVKTGVSLADFTTAGPASIEIKMVKQPTTANTAKDQVSVKENVSSDSQEINSAESIEKHPDNTHPTTALPVNSELNPQVVEAHPEVAQPVDNSTKKGNDGNGDLAASAPTVVDSLKKEISPASEVSPLILDGVTEEPKFLPARFSVEAGMSYLSGWKNPEGRDAKGFNPVIGINYFSPVTSKTSLSFGIQYSSVGNLSYSNYTSKVTHLKLGEESEVSVYTPVKLHYLIVPIRFNYDLGLKNTVGLGCNVAYLWNVESELETYTEKLNSTEGHSVSRTFGYAQGFKKIDTQMSAFYRRRLYPNLSVNAEVFFGLTDIKDNKFFNSNRVERNTGVKLTLVYNILKK